jgi:hypothetical protein
MNDLDLLSREPPEVTYILLGCEAKKQLGTSIENGIFLALEGAPIFDSG